MTHVLLRPCSSPALPAPAPAPSPASHPVFASPLRRHRHERHGQALDANCVVGLWRVHGAPSSTRSVSRAPCSSQRAHASPLERSPVPTCVNVCVFVCLCHGKNAATSTYPHRHNPEARACAYSFSHAPPPHHPPIPYPSYLAFDIAVRPIICRAASTSYGMWRSRRGAGDDGGVPLNFILLHARHVASA